MTGDIRGLGEELLREIGLKEGFNNEEVIKWKSWLQSYSFCSDYTDDPYAWLTDVLALKSVDSGNYGVGSIIVDRDGETVAFGHNLMYSPSFRSDLHAEMVTLNYFEEKNPQITTLKDYTLYTSLESCPMCIIRLISAGINRVFHVSPDSIGGMADSINLMPPLWKELSEPQVFAKASCSYELSKAATAIMLINADELLEILRKRRL
ncbi:nucleoside deaminase [Methanosarcina mazei]|jgi:cytosine deaminase|uniref:Cytosine deaminase n=8 Tax=Methanosarcina mazei TaxID=2209 RepID=A0A0F8CT54_METMZ|nr:nucleoside deaminase [Methanosarcina mazei]AAM32801.1 putative cytosine deaminase [Methanosarcina mazei Go1]AGF98453.1 Cytosine deaminase [Methanosarcina mazei Tuc01]AKB40525.1 tRNA-specific adenosine-34 deaminase [Methanosarcina mazei WWM610]AKB61482.1 tRNA-specific adenosine-34 deaminase [Methanosarcina mazei SarPi]AKB64775.1 tRNA-specific adenosine-34 deaminase [Methanosarcina mazei S-6]